MEVRVLSTATKWMATIFMAMSLGMAWNATRSVDVAPVEDDLGVMSEVPATGAIPSADAPTGEVPVIPAADVPADVPAADAAPVEAAPADAAPAEETPAENAEKSSQGG